MKRSEWLGLLCVVMAMLLYAGGITWGLSAGRADNLRHAQELVQKHCAATDIGETAVIYTCDGGKHLVREVN